MSFGKKKQQDKKDLRMPTLSTPFGTVKGGKKGSVSLSPSYLPGQQQAMYDASSMFGQSLQGMPTSTNVQQAFDNPFSDALMSLARSDVGREAEDARRQLTAQQAARGDLRNSSGLYAQSLLDRNIGNTMADAMLKARLGGFDAYSQNENQNIQRATFFQNAMAALQNQMLEPLRIYQGIAPTSNQLQMANMGQQQQKSGGGLFSSAIGAFGGAIPKLFAGG